MRRGMAAGHPSDEQRCRETVAEKRHGQVDVFQIEFRQRLVLEVDVLPDATRRTVHVGHRRKLQVVTLARLDRAGVVGWRHLQYGTPWQSDYGSGVGGMMRRLRDLRAYIGALEKIGEIQRIDAEVSLDYEIGAIVRRSYDLMAPAPLFTNIAGVAPGFRVFGAPAGVSGQPGLYLSRVAVSLGLDPEAGGMQIVDALVRARGVEPLPPEVVSTGPCKEVIAVGDDVDLRRLPAPLLHGHDGGRYINTYGMVVARTPDGSWTNWSIARVQLMDARRMPGS